MIETASVVDTYIAFWNAPDEARRRAMLEEAFAPYARYIGPLVETEGHDGIAAMASRFKENLAGYEIRRTSDVDAHHYVLRYTWQIVPPDGGEVFAAGVDFCELASDGRIGSVTMFLDVAPAGMGEHQNA